MDFLEKLTNFAKKIYLMPVLDFSPRVYVYPLRGEN